VISSAKISVVNTEYDNWNGGTYGYTVYVNLSVKQYTSFSSDKIAEMEKVISEAFNESIKGNSNNYFKVQIGPSLSKEDIDWSAIGGLSGRATLKQNIDTITRQLKALSTDYSASIIAISSINRTSYKSNTIGSFKESGSIEYTADYLISLEEKETTNNLAFNTDDNIITLTFLKNRFGTKDSIDLKYYGNYATFIEN
jgi:replicative DNA helicase